METELIKWQPIHTMVEEYSQAQIKITQGLALLAEAKGHMGTFGAYRNTVIPRNFSDYDLNNGGKKTCLNAIKQQAWQGIVEKAQVRNLMSEHRSHELDRQLDNVKDLPELTVENVHAFIEGLASNLDTLLAETIKETFDILRPPRSEYKTNTEFEIGERAILNYVIDHDKWSFTRLSYYAEQRLRCIDNVFHLLDGQGPIKWPGDMVTIIRQAIHDKEWACETEYFECKWYKKGSLHIKFKRMGLVKELNKRAGGDRIKPM